MRCEHCGCVGVGRSYTIERAEVRRVVGLVLCLLVPVAWWLATNFGRPYCVRCRRRVKGNGVSPGDRRRAEDHHNASDESSGFGERKSGEECADGTVAGLQLLDDSPRQNQDNADVIDRRRRLRLDRPGQVLQPASPRMVRSQ